MQRFTYKATDKKTGKTVKGNIQAESERAAGKILLEEGYIPDKIVSETKGSFIAKLKNKIRAQDRIVFTRQFATLIGAGLPLAASLRTAAEQATSKAMKAVIEEILTDVEAGRTLSESMGKHPDVFSDVYLSLVAAGEMSGTLDQALQELATQDEKDAAMISKIRGAMVYPAIILVVIIAVLIFMMFAVVPEVDKLYSDMDKELPGLTAALVVFTNFLVSFWWLILLILVAISVMGVRYFRTDMGKALWAGFKLNVPIFKGLFQRLYMTRFARTMQMLLMTGVSMLDAIRISSKATANVIMEKELMKAAEKVRSGKPLSESLTGLSYILPLVPQMSSIGEQSGKIDEMLGRAAQVYESELDEKIANISTMIEPILMVVMAGLIGLVVAGTLLPIYSLVSSI